MDDLRPIENTSTSGWCAGCGCGWHKAIDAFDVTPPEAECRRLECDCHNSYWDSDPVLVHSSPEPDWDQMRRDGVVIPFTEDELETRWRYGDR
jgi:hypothetical protein